MHNPNFAALKPYFAAVVLAGALSACGGGGGGGSTSSSGASNGSSTGGSSASSNTFVSSIFLQSGGSGYNSFVSSENSSAQYAGIAREQLWITSASSTVFSEQTSAVIGQYTATATRMTLVTASGEFSTLGFGSDVQIGAQSSNGFTFGLGGSPAVLQATITSTDISGQPIGSVANDAIGGVSHTLSGDTTAMPTGSIRYSTQVTATAPILVVQAGSTTSLTLAQLEQQYGGTIATLGDASYLTGMGAGAPAPAFAQYSGAVYPATYVAAGQVTPLSLLAGTEIAYNQTAASFIVQELQTHASGL